MAVAQRAELAVWSRARPAGRTVQRQRAAEGAVPGGRDGGRGGFDRRHGPAAARRDDRAVRRGPGAVHAGLALRSYTWGNVSPLEKAGREFLIALAGQAPVLPGAGTLAFIDIDSMQKRVYGHQKQGARFGHAKIGGNRCWSGVGRPGRDGQHAAVGAGDRRHQAARWQRRLRARRGQPHHAGHRRRAAGRLHRDDHRPAGLGVFTTPR